MAQRSTRAAREQLVVTLVLALGLAGVLVRLRGRLLLRSPAVVVCRAHGRKKGRPLFFFARRRWCACPTS